MYRISSSLLIGLLTASSLYAQTSANGSVRGVVTDEQGAVLPGVSIVATSETVPGVHAATTVGDGTYRLLDLPPGDYIIVATLPSFESPESQVTVRAGGNRTLNLVMTIGPIDETVDVTQDTPLLETQRPAQSVQISGELLRSMPLSERREWSGALTLAPGVTTAEWANSETIFYVHGADSIAHVVQIDGADMTPPVGSPIRMIGLNTDSIDDIQVRTSGVDASAPLGLGGIIHIATASGTNTAKGAATLFAQPRSWNSSNAPGGTSSAVDQIQTDLSVGAPIMKDRLWAFAGYRHVDVENGISRTPEQLEALRALVPGFKPFDGENRADWWFLKVNGQLSPSHHVAGFYQYDVNPVTSAQPDVARPESRATGGSGGSLRLSSVWSHRVTTRLAASYTDKGSSGEDPEADEPLQAIYESTIPSGGRLVGTGRVIGRGAPQSAWSTSAASNVNVSFDATIFGTGWFGSHEVQTGFYAQPRLAIDNRTNYVNRGVAFEEAVLFEPRVLDGGVLPFHRLIFEGHEITRVRRRGEDYAFYIQDSWRPILQLTISAGVRIDHIVWTDRLFDVTSQASTEVGPRLGLNYALTSDARDIIKAHWVRVHDRPASTGTSAGTAALGQRDLYDVDLDGTFETVFVTPPTFAVTPSRSIAPGFHQPFVHEWGVGYAKQFDGGLAAGVDVVRRDFRDRPTLVETNGHYDGHVFIGYIDDDFNDVYQVTNNRWNRPVYTSFELSATKRSSGIQAIASYVRQWRHIRGTWQPNDPASFIQPTAFPNDRGIGSTTGSTAASSQANSLSGLNMTQVETASAQWQDHVVRLGVACDGPWKTILATNYVFQSGAWSGPIITRVDEPDLAFGPPTMTLANGRTVENPLATTFRFAFPTRGEEQLTTPNLHVWNVRVGRRFLLGPAILDASLDLFNLTNNGADTSFAVGGHQIFSPDYGMTMFRQRPRSAQLVVRATF